jgi:hypothetical protein
LAFCDQDDVWLQNRFDFFANHKKSDQPEIHIGRGILTDEAGRNIGVTKKLRPNPPNKSFLHNQATGCFTVVNRALVKEFDALTKRKKIPVLHDWLAFCIASDRGRVFFYNEMWVRYRQHSMNDTGYEARQILRIWMAVRRLRPQKRLVNAERLACYIDSQAASSFGSILESQRWQIFLKLRHTHKLDLFHLSQLWIILVILTAA